MPDQRNHHPLALALFSLLSALMVAHAIYHYTILPDRIATHFGLWGEPDAWGSKSVFFIWYGIIGLLLVGTWAWVKRRLTPGHTSWLNIPNKEYWLAPERQAETLSWLRTGLLLGGSGTLLFLLDLMHQSFQVSLGKATKLTHIVTSLGIYLTFCVVWIIAIYRRFERKG